MKIKLFGGPLDGAEFDADLATLPPTLVFPDHDSWNLYSEEMFLANGQVVYDVQTFPINTVHSEIRFVFDPSVAYDGECSHSPQEHSEKGCQDDG